MRFVALACLILAELTSVCKAVDLFETRRPPPGAQFTYSWTKLPLLPGRLRNHCYFVKGHYICEDHCGIDYQVYYCSRRSTGCCQVGHGYCDEDGIVRCTPTLF